MTRPLWTVWTRQELYLAIRSVLSEQSGMDVQRITDDSRIGNDLGIGAVIGNAEFLELEEALEKVTGVSIPAKRTPADKDLPGVTFKQVVDLFWELLPSNQKTT